jgi:hypothetical protein
MSKDEVLITVLGLVFGPGAWALLFLRLAIVARYGRRPGDLSRLAGILVACGVVLAWVLLRFSAGDVRRTPAYLIMYFLLGLAWLRLSESLFAYAGVSLRDDVFERGNGAALPAVSGALMGVTLCYAGGNAGDGPGWWVVLFSASLATAGLGASWLSIVLLTRIADVVTIDRDPAAGIRLGGFLAGSGLILGRAVAGDWQSVRETLFDFLRVGWAVAPLLALGILVESVARPSVDRPRGPRFLAGWLPALAYLLMAGAYVLRIGRPQ